MIQDRLVPKFERGEEVVIVDEKGFEVCRGPLMGIQKKSYSILEFTIGNEKIDVYSGFRTSKYVLSAKNFDDYLSEINTKEYSDVADKFVAYARRGFTEEERERVDALVDELADIARVAAEREYKNRKGQGASPESFQGMWGNHDLSRAKIESSARKEMMFGLKWNYDSVYAELRSLEQDDSVIAIGTGKPIKQSALKNGTDHE